MGLLNPIKSMPHIYKPPAPAFGGISLNSLLTSLSARLRRLTKMTDSTPLKGKFSKGVGVEPDVFKFDKPTIMRNVAQGQLPVDAASHLPASEIELGLIIVGAGLAITEEGVLSATSPEGGITSIQEGAGISVDSTDLSNPIVSANVASETDLGAIKVGNNLSMRPDGTLDAASGPGGGIATIKSGPGIGVDATDANNPIVSTDVATTATLGAIKVGKNLTVTADGTLDAEGGGGVVDKIQAGPGVAVDSTDPSAPEIGITPATAEAIGGIKVGKNLTVTADGTLDAEGGGEITPATKTTLGGVIVGDGLNVSEAGILSTTAPGPGPTPGAGKVVILTGNDYSYTVKPTDFDITLCFVDVTADPRIFIDGDVQSSIGQLIHCIFTGPYNPQVIPINNVRLDTGGLGGGRAGGRSVGYNRNTAEDYKKPAFSMEADLICVADKFWVFRSSLLQMGAPFIEYAGVVRNKFTPGACEIISNAEGEDYARIFQINYIATPSKKALPTVSANRKPKFGGDPYILSGLVEGESYKVSTEWEFMNIPGDPPPYLKALSINAVNIVAPSSLPPAPTNVQIKGFRGPKMLFTFDYPAYAPIWTKIEVEITAPNGTVLTKNGDETYVVCGDNITDSSPFFKNCFSIQPDQVPSILPGGIASSFNNCSVKLRLTTADGKRGILMGQGFNVDFKDGATAPAVTVKNIDRQSKRVDLSWAVPEPGYDAPECKLTLKIYQGASLQFSQTVRWNDGDASFQGEHNTNYIALLVGICYKVDGNPGPSVTFQIPNPF